MRFRKESDMNNANERDAATNRPVLPIGASVGPLSISDDDLCSCSACARLRYAPGELSECLDRWPGLADADGYVQSCDAFSSCRGRSNVVTQRATTSRGLPC
jgi:hypothetical protein